MKPVVVMLSIHPVGDNRICKYQVSLSEDYEYKVFNIHFLSLTNCQSDTELIIPISKNKFKKRFEILFYKNSILKKIKNLISDFSNSVFIIHDPILLLLTKKIKKYGAKIIYDRHEYYEGMKKFNLISEDLLYEKLHLKYVDYLICVNEKHAGKTKLLFKKFDKNNIIAIHNYPSIKNKISKNVLKEVKSEVPVISYIGSMNWNADRDIQLMLDCIEALEINKINYKCFFAGKVFDDCLLKKLKLLQCKTNNKFEYLGVIDRSKTIELTSASHVGFFFLCDSFTEACSPNKVFEYIYYGVIPFTRFICSDDLSAYGGYMYDFDTDINKIINDFLNLISDKQLIDKKIDHILNLGCPFLWDEDIKKIPYLLDSSI